MTMRCVKSAIVALFSAVVSETVDNMWQYVAKVAIIH